MPHHKKREHQSHHSEMAPNAGYGDGYHRDSSHHDAAMNHYGPSQIGVRTSNAYITEWGDPGYAMHQLHDGSMNYISEKDAIATSDMHKVHRTGIKETMR